MNTVLLEKHDGFAIVTLNRPEAMNALSRELRGDFVAAFRECAEDPAIRVVILTGNGKAFCAGFDLKELGAGAAKTTADEAGKVAGGGIEMPVAVNSAEPPKAFELEN